MEIQRDRRRDPYPWTWEPWAASLLGFVFLQMITLQTARGVANLIAGAGWTWPETTSATGPDTPLGGQLMGSLLGIIRGDAAAGLPGTTTGARSQMADPVLLWTVTAVAETGLIVSLCWAAAWLYRRWGPGRIRGLATADEARTQLGAVRLRRHAAVIRPDLYGTGPTPDSAALAPVHRTAGEAKPPRGNPGDTDTALGSGLREWLLPRRQPSPTPAWRIRLRRRRHNPGPTISGPANPEAGNPDAGNSGWGGRP